MIFQKIENNNIGFYLTNFFPRKFLTSFFGRLSHSSNPFIVKGLLLLFRIFCGDLNLSESKEQNFKTFHDYFIRELKKDARPIDNTKKSIISPVDGIMGSFGYIEKGQLFQIKNEIYNIKDLLDNDQSLIEKFNSGTYFTLRIKPNFYHRFHMIMDGHLQKVNFIPGELWNINTATLMRVKSLFTKNERIILYGSNKYLHFSIIPVGTVLVGSIRLNFLKHSFSHVEKFPYNLSINTFSNKGEELGMFHYGSTVLVLLSKRVKIPSHIQTSNFIKFGELLGTI